MNAVQRVTRAYQQGILTLGEVGCFLVRAVNEDDSAGVMASVPPAVSAEIRDYLDNFPTTAEGWSDWSRQFLLRLRYEAPEPGEKRLEVEESRMYRRGVEVLREYFAARLE